MQICGVILLSASGLLSANPQSRARRTHPAAPSFRKSCSSATRSGWDTRPGLPNG